MKRSILILFVCVCTGQLYPQVTITGTVRDQLTGEYLISATIFEMTSRVGTTSNEFGVFSLSIPRQDSIRLQIRYIGYRDQIYRMPLIKDSLIVILLTPGIEISEVEIKSDPNHARIESPQTSLIRIPIRQLQSIPSLLGERDIFKAYQLMPGVQGGRDGFSGMFIRGGSPDQNLILLDDIPLYNVSHLGGFLSVFNPDVISSADLYKGGFPARYSGRLSAILDVRMKDGNFHQAGGTYTFGLLTQKITFEGPVRADRSSYLISFRRSIYDLFTRAYGYLSGGKFVNGYNLTDGNAKLNFKLGDRDRLIFSIYGGIDNLFGEMNDKFDSPDYSYRIRARMNLRWGNQSVSGRWNHIFSSSLFMNTTIGYVRFFNEKVVNAKLFEEDNRDPSGQYLDRFRSEISDMVGKTDFHYNGIAGHAIRFGGSFIQHLYNPVTHVQDRSRDGITIIDTVLQAPRVNSSEFGVYAEDEFSIKKVTLNLGVNLSGFLVNSKFYPDIQPRVLASYKLSDDLSIKSSFSSMVQYVHLVSRGEAGMPTDQWIPSTERISPARSQMVVVGFMQNLGRERKLELTIEGYYKKMTNLIEFGEGQSADSHLEDWQSQLISGGRGTVYGVEFLLQKKKGLTTGWVGYTWSKNFRQFNEIDNGEPFPYQYDRRHVISLVVNHEINDQWSFSATWIYSSGYAMTLALWKYPIQVLDTEPTYWLTGSSDWAFLYEPRNNYRMPSYHRLDIGFHYIERARGKQRRWSFEIFNLYNRLNPTFVYFNEDKNNEMKLQSISMFPIIPSISCRYEW